jgi:DNA internalization-related competence protein ComEC/Rec2
VKRPILYCAISFSAGIALAGLPIPTLYLVSVCFISIILAAVLFRNNIMSHIFLYLALLFFGAAYCQNYDMLPDNHIAKFVDNGGAKIYLRGVIIDDPVIKKAYHGRNKISCTVEAKSIKRDTDEAAVMGLAKVDIYTKEAANTLNIGDELVVKGTLSRPEGLRNPGLLDYSRYLRIRNIYAILSVGENSPVELLSSRRVNPVIERAYRVRRSITDAITRYVDKPYSGFLNAILVGERSELDSSITDDFVKTGTVHVIAISGLNIALVAGIFLVIFRVFGIKKKLNLILTSLAIVFYCFVAGSSPPVVRATVMFVIASIGYVISREPDILNSLALAAFLMLLANPKELFDPSFQLSFGSIISIVLFAPRIEEAFGKKTNYFIKSAAVSLAASIGLFPIVARYFNIVSPVAVLANLVIVPALFVLTVVSFVFLLLNITGAVFLLGWMGILLSLLTKATFYANHIFAGIPFSHIRIPAPSPFFMVIYYSLLAYIFFTKNIKHIIAVSLIAVNILVWSQVITYPARQLKITFLDVGKGDSSLVQFPGKGTMLIDGGSGGLEGMADTGKSVVAPYLWNNGIRKLDAVVVTHFHEDHLGGLIFILENFNIGSVIDNGEPSSDDMALYEKYIGIIKKKGIRRIIVGDGDEITGFGGAKILVLNPVKSGGDTDANDSSIVLKIIYNNFSALFCADISSRAMGRIMTYGELLKSDIIKMPHHGGDVGDKIVAKRFFDIISPGASVTSAGGRYRFSNISRSTQELIDSLDSINYQTKNQGAISVTSDGEHFNVAPFCKKN